MELQILKSERMQQSGKAILRSLQNDNLPITDVIIREALQNSLDAANLDESYVDIQINVEEFDTINVAHYFKGISDELQKRYPDPQLVLSIRDSKTSGLTGIIEGSNEDKKKSKFYKLVYGLSMNQDEAGSGGSWGLGKTSFFRVGCGLVLYYSRSKEQDGKYIERIAASLIENEEETDSLLGSYSSNGTQISDYNGIAWWGEKEDKHDVYSDTLPIEDEEIIQRLTEKFGVTRYGEDETGTTIIIPFIDNKLVELDRDSNKPNDDQELEDRVYWWETSFKDSIEMSIQRWYGPRLMNQEYYNFFNQPFLVAKVNNNIVTNKEIVFNIFQTLYNAALLGKSEDSRIQIQSIDRFRGVLENTSEIIGRIAYIDLSKEEFGMIPPDFLASPLAYIGETNQITQDKSGNRILAYARKPGMIVEYVVNDSKWTGGVSVEENQFLLAFFVPNSNVKLSSEYKNSWENLEAYLRDTEAADHANWMDKAIGQKKITILDRIRKQVSKKIREYYLSKNNDGMNTVVSTLSREYGEIFLPPTNFGTSAKSGVNSQENESRSTNSNIGKLKKDKTIFKIVDSEPLNNETLKVYFEGYINKGFTTRIYTEVSTSDKKYDILEWTKRMESSIEYPFKIDNIVISKVNNRPYIEEEIKIITTSINKSTSVDISNLLDMELFLEGEILVHINNPLMSLELSANSVLNEEGRNNV